MLTDLTTIRTLPAKLTEGEVNTYARRVSEKCLRVQELEEEKSRVAKQIKGHVDGLSAEIADLSWRVKKREEPREIECHWVYRWDVNVKELIRSDTYELVETRPIEAYEKQQKLALDARGAAEDPRSEEDDRIDADAC